jgi:predicted esterase
MNLASPVVLPPLEKKNHTATVIWMHGLGDTGFGWKDVMEIIQAKNPHIKFILPTAYAHLIKIICNVDRTINVLYLFIFTFFL